MKKHQKCRFTVVVEDKIVCCNEASEHHLDSVCEDVKKCDGCSQYFSHIDSDNLCNSDDSTGGIDYESK